MPSYKVTKTGTQREFTPKQVQSLRALYGHAVQLVRNASGPAVFDHPETERIVQGGDFVKLEIAIEKVKNAMKEKT